MAIADITIIPIGTASPSVSKYVADIQRVLEARAGEGLITYELAPMSTLIEGELTDLFKVIQELHESVFSEDIKRVATNIRIDERRDRNDHSMQNKLASVKKHLSK
ncbi:MTH1187 family thiamine-binding protein [Jeotgalibacillus haloalkalitolerans]|uniref:MTH1187 family thiamine-binding protein n=1 Tax=Jeotgalibacillus haloalkalitolerans TaxID=3104292 RepID=A0ABU5KLM8_9BACL|nr:MTH1187 family thiamine-binding protein [Jeotgalibacillus sp. HH7-29]MDZ5712161.1 MTH1187 family thiamine-binding protein [Jeotgalibacillus sp. HH7-29]